MEELCRVKYRAIILSSPINCIGLSIFCFFFLSPWRLLDVKQYSNLIKTLSLLLNSRKLKDSEEKHIREGIFLLNFSVNLVIQVFYGIAYAERKTRGEVTCSNSGN